MEQILNLPVQMRSATFVPDTIDAEKRSVDVTWSTGASVRRTDWWTGKSYNETLSLDPAHVNLDRLNSGAPLLNGHENALGSVLGVVEKAWIENGAGRATVRFSARHDAEAVFKDVRDGIIRNISVGYAVQKYEVTEEKGSLPIWRAVDWMPMEISAVAVGADSGAGFRKNDTNTISCQIIHIRGTDMSDEQTKAVDAAAVDTPVLPILPPIEDSTRAIIAAKTAAVTLERARIAAIYDAQEKLKLDRSLATKLAEDGTEIDVARKILIDAAAATPVNVVRGHVVSGGLDERTTRNAAVESAILHRFSPNEYKLTDAARDWGGYTLLEMARSFLKADGFAVGGETKYELATRAMHSTSDFPSILANVASKTLRAAYEANTRTFTPFCRQVTASDFKAVYRVQLGEAPALEKLPEGGEYKRGTLGEAKESYRIETFGKVIAISRQMIINDDLNAFTRIPQMLGAAAANLESDTIWKIITDNPTMGDGITLFHANHKNLAATASAISVASLGLARKSMSMQSGVNPDSVINIRPAYIIVPAALEVAAEQLLAVNMVPAKSTDVVPQSMRTLTVITEPRLDAAVNGDKAWYLAANPDQIDTIEYAYLEGQNGVYIETRSGFDVDGVEIKARMDFGAKAIDHRGFYKNAGV